MPTVYKMVSAGRVKAFVSFLWVWLNRLTSLLNKGFLGKETDFRKKPWWTGWGGHPRLAGFWEWFLKQSGN